MVDRFCIPVLLYGLEALDNKSTTINSIYFAYNGVFVKLFNIKIKISMVNSNNFVYDYYIRHHYILIMGRGVRIRSQILPLTHPSPKHQGQSLQFFNIFYLTYLIFLFFKTCIIWVFGVRKTISQLLVDPRPPFPQT